MGALEDRVVDEQVFYQLCEVPEQSNVQQVKLEIMLRLT
jgi:hypothetical protein